MGPHIAASKNIEQSGGVAMREMGEIIKYKNPSSSAIQDVERLFISTKPPAIQNKAHCSEAGRRRTLPEHMKEMAKAGLFKNEEGDLECYICTQSTSMASVTGETDPFTLHNEDCLYAALGKGNFSNKATLKDDPQCIGCETRPPSVLYLTCRHVVHCAGCVLKKINNHAEGLLICSRCNSEVKHLFAGIAFK